jgi:small subunit ribosomal protein S16
MPTKIRLQRFGKKGYAYYHIVVADSRAPRDGRIIERIGSYNPNTNPATIEVDRDRAADWLIKGAQPTDTARAILSYRGALYKHHLMRGVQKGALSQEQAEQKLAEWDAQKAGKIDQKVSGLEKSREEAAKQRLEAESKVREARETAIKEKLAAANVGEAAEGETADAPAEAAAETTEAPAPEAAAEAAAEEAPAAEAPAEEPKAEAAEKEEEKKEDSGDSEAK